MTIINLTQHAPTAEQLSAGVVDAPDTEAVRRLLTFHAPPSRGELAARAFALAEIARLVGAKGAMIGGFGPLMGPLELALDAAGVEPLHAFSVRESVEETLADGSVRKATVFRHKGWVRPRGPARAGPLLEVIDREDDEAVKRAYRLILGAWPDMGLDRQDVLDVLDDFT